MGKRVVAALLALCTINTPALAYIETVCMTRGSKPVLVTVRADDGDVIVRGGDGPWFEATAKVQTQNGHTYVHARSENSQGVMVVTFSSANSAGLLTFKLNNGKVSQYDATCVSTIRSE